MRISTFLAHLERCINKTYVLNEYNTLTHIERCKDTAYKNDASIFAYSNALRVLKYTNEFAIILCIY